MRRLALALTLALAPTLAFGQIYVDGRGNMYIGTVAIHDTAICDTMYGLTAYTTAVLYQKQFEYGYHGCAEIPTGTKALQSGDGYMIVKGVGSGFATWYDWQSTKQDGNNKAIQIPNLYTR